MGEPILATPLFPNPVFDVGSIPASIALGDFNADGRQDLVVANNGSGDVSVLLGLGDGTFGAELRFAAGILPRSVASGDFNADGRQDLAVANGGSNDVSVLLGQGDGTFGPQTRFGAGGEPYSIALGDFNADGSPDLVVVNHGSHDVSVLLGRGDGTFGPQAHFGVGGGPVSIAVEDFNGDGRQDLAVANGGSNDVSVLLGQGNGIFGPQTRFGAGNNPHTIVVGDFNADGGLDLAVANHAGCCQHGVTVLLGLGDGTFGPGTSFMAGENSHSIAIGDFDADGRQDLAVANYGRYGPGGDVSVLLGQGDGTFGTQTVFQAGGQPSSIVAGDFNGDRRQDLAMANLIIFSDGDVSVLLGRGDGTFGSSFEAGEGSYAMTVGDFNADGRQDLAVTNPPTDGVSILMGEGDGTFGAPTRFEAGDGPLSIALGDFNADGRQDLAVADYTTSEVSVLLGRGDGAFGPPTRFGTGYLPHSIAVGDFNADGRQDLVVANLQSDYVSVLLGLGDGTFSPQARIGVVSGSGFVAVGDFNADGHQDLAVATYDGSTGTISVLLGEGDGTFGAETRFGAGNALGVIAVGDFNGDGRQDLAAANVNSSTYGDVSVLLGQGAGVFGPPTRFRVGFEPRSIAVGDFNADGRQDLAVANAHTHDVSFLPGRGDGTFAPQSRFGAGNNPHTIAVGDFNGDGRQDLAVANSFSNDVSVLLNQGSLPAHRPPVAVAGAEARVECTSPSGALLHLDGSASSDPDSTPGTNDDIESFQWFENFGTPSQALLGSSHRLTVTLGLGQHLLTLRVTDSAGASATAQVTGAVVDTTPPSLTLTMNPVSLWPPNQKLVPVQAAWQVNDACDPAAGVVLASVTSSEPGSAAGSGSTSGDIQDASIGTPDPTVLLRAARSGGGPGRVYTLTYTATDESGNSASALGSVTVAKPGHQP